MNQAATLATASAQKMKLYQDSDYAVASVEGRKCQDAARALAATGGCVYVDLDPVITDNPGTASAVLKPIYDDQGGGPGTGDHIHANQAGQDQMMAVLQAAWS